MRKIEQLEEYIEELRAEASTEQELSRTSEEEEYAMGYLDALQDVVNAIEGVWGWTKLKN